MSESDSPGSTVRREIGRLDDGRPGPTLLVLAGIHGNEPAGIVAAQRVLARLQERETPVRGRMVAFAGNLKALAQRRRFVQRDLNRGWDEAAVRRLQATDTIRDNAEDQEQRELLHCFDEVLRTASGPVLFVDLHTSSADGPPFLCLADTIDNRRLGLATGIPIILGIEEAIEGASLEWFAERGICALAVEGGRHEHPDTIGNHASLLWRLLVHLRIVGEAAAEPSSRPDRLVHSCRGVPAVVEVVHRHVIAPAAGFRMQPGFVNFARVAKGTLLAQDRQGDIRAPADCHVLLPLYQAVGDDGFFLARRVRPFWLLLARWLRALRCDAVLRVLPGVRRDRQQHDLLLVDRRVARWYVTEIFHLLGYRRVCAQAGMIAFRRRWSRRENRRL